MKVSSPFMKHHSDREPHLGDANSCVWFLLCHQIALGLSVNLRALIIKS